MKDFIVWFIPSLFSTFSFSYLYYKLTDSKEKIGIFTIIVFIVGALFVSILRYYNLMLVSFIAFFIFYPFLYYCLNKLRFKKLFFYSLFTWLYGMFFDLIFMVIISLLNFIFDFNIYNPIFKILPSILLSFTLIYLANLKIFKRFTNYIYKVFQKVEYFNLSAIAISLFVFIGGIALFINIKHLRVSILLFLVIFFLSIIIILMLKFRMDSLENKLFLKTLKENNDFYIKMDDENRIFKHNLTAKLMSIESVSNKKAKVLIDDFIKFNNKTINYSKQIKEIPYGLNGIIYQKLYPYLDKLSIKINNQVKYDIFEVLTPRKYNVFVEKVLLSIDNAVESAIKSKRKLLTVDLYDDNDNLVCEIGNSFSNNLNIDELGGKEYSTKGKKRGLGLFSMLRDKEAIVKIEIINDIFISRIATKKRLNN